MLHMFQQATLKIKIKSLPFSLDRNRMQFNFRLGHTILTMEFTLDSNHPCVSLLTKI